jgi:hypothetical protein
MTTPARVYQNVSYQELLRYAETNPHRARTLDSMEIRMSIVKETSLDSLLLPGYTAFSLYPTGIISLFACLSDPHYYMLAPPSVRTELIMALTTTLQEEVETLRTTPLARKRKHLYELIGKAFHGARMEEKDYDDLFQGISYIREIQFVIMKEAVQERVEEGHGKRDGNGNGNGKGNGDQDAYVPSGVKGEIHFSSNPMNWKKEHATWLVDHHARWVAMPSGASARPFSSLVGEWIVDMEGRGWIIQWPEVEATKVELVERLSARPTWQETDRKLLKEILAVRLGKALTLQLFHSW